MIEYKEKIVLQKAVLTRASSSIILDEVFYYTCLDKLIKRNINKSERQDKIKVLNNIKR